MLIPSVRSFRILSMKFKSFIQNFELCLTLHLSALRVGPTFLTTLKNIPILLNVLINAFLPYRRFLLAFCCLLVAVLCCLEQSRYVRHGFGRVTRSIFAGCSVDRTEQQRVDIFMCELFTSLHLIYLTFGNFFH